MEGHALAWQWQTPSRKEPFKPAFCGDLDDLS
jgi:hypothetical protein